MLNSENWDDDGLDDYDRARASDMEECRPIYAATGSDETDEEKEPEQNGEEV
jgi:hypothetical protein